MAEKFNVTGDQHFGITGQMLEIQRQIRLKGGSPIDPQLVALALQDVIEGKFARTSKKNDSILRLISKGESIIIETCDGTQTIAEAETTFASGIDGDFKKWGTNKRGNGTEKTAVQVHELIQNATFAQMFGSLGTDLDKLYLTQHQIKIFCEVHKEWLRKDGGGTFFLFKVEDQFFVTFVYVLSDGLNVQVERLESEGVLRAEGAHRLVVPELKS